MPEDTYQQLLQAATARYHALLYQSYSQLSLDDKIFIENFRYYKQMSLNQVVQTLDEQLRQIQGKDYWSTREDTTLFNVSIDR
ncbi:MAG: hypothetical protein RIG63_11245 [Coleofasciculus chthonoplastes F3-SA18-01]|jgi:hypothetical protein|uniref:hypothetical protein n=1 Tax=Coleofasciculus chthonoplastes TaxID=64178 RepID=UPI0032F6D46A